MKILWLSHLIPYPPKGGVLQRSYNLIRELSKYHEVSLLAFNQSALLGSMFSSVSAGKKEAKRHLLEFCNDVEFVDIPSEKEPLGKYILALKSLFTRYPYTVNWLASKEMSFLIEKILGNNQFDLIHFDTISLAIYLPHFGDTPKVLDHHNIESHMMLRRAEQEQNLLKKFYYYQEGKKLSSYEKTICKDFDLHITCSELDSERLRSIDSGLNIDEIPNGVDVEYFIPNSENEQGARLVFAGGLNWYPNQDAMLFFAREIWPILKRRCPEIEMDLIGKNPPKELCDLGERDQNYHVHGFVDDVRGYISRASVYVCPIRDGGGTKLKLLDAFSMGKAVVAHPAACEGIDITEDENVFLAENANAFSDKIIDLLGDRNKRRRVGLSARMLVEKSYSFVRIGQKLSSNYELLVKFSSN